MLEALYICACLALGVLNPPPMPTIVYLQEPRPGWQPGARGSFDGSTVYILDRSLLVISHELAHACQHATRSAAHHPMFNPDYEQEAWRIARACLEEDHE